MFRALCKWPKNIHSIRTISNSPELIVQHLEGSDKGITIFELNRPKQKNAISTNLLNQIKTSLSQLNFHKQTRVLILRSLVPGVFCSGADLKERFTMTKEQVGEFVRNIRHTISQFHYSPIPVIAALDGLALGGGLEIALACDLRIATTSTKMGLVETKLAIIPGAGGTQRLPRLINPAIAKELIYTARIIDGQEAHRLGIVNHVVSQNDTTDSAFQRSLELAREILPNGPVAIEMAKKAINLGLEMDLKGGLEVEDGCYEVLVGTKDRVEGLEAFKAKRRPIYVGS